jgi:hypothetical protein
MQTKFGNQYAYHLNNLEKKEIIENVYNNIPISRYRYNILYKNELNLLKKDFHNVSLNNNGSKYFLVFSQHNGNPNCYYIDKKTLKYNKKNININDINIYSCKHRVHSDYYKLTIIDGDLVQTKENFYVFYICDIYYLKGEKKYHIPIKDKLKELKADMITNYKIDNTVECCPLRINQLYTYNDIDYIIKYIIPNIDYVCSGFVFYPRISGSKIIYKFSKIEFRQILTKKYDIILNYDEIKLNSNLLEQNECTENDYNNKDNQKQSISLKNIKTYNIIINFEVWKTDFPDVYDLYLKDVNNNTKKQGIAYIPTLDCSRFIFTLFNKNNTNKIIMQCKYSLNNHKWIPFKYDPDKNKCDSITALNKIQNI